MLYSVYCRAGKLKLKLTKALEEVLKRFMQSRGQILSFGWRTCRTSEVETCNKTVLLSTSCTEDYFTQTVIKACGNIAGVCTK